MREDVHIWNSDFIRKTGGVQDMFFLWFSAFVVLTYDTHLLWCYMIMKHFTQIHPSLWHWVSWSPEPWTGHYLEPIEQHKTKNHDCSHGHTLITSDAPGPACSVDISPASCTSTRKLCWHNGSPILPECDRSLGLCLADFLSFELQLWGLIHSSPWWSLL